VDVILVLNKHMLIVVVKRENHTQDLLQENARILLRWRRQVIEEVECVLPKQENIIR